MSKEDYNSNLNRRLEEQKWLEDIISKSGYCLLCGYNDNPLIIERHHIAGKNNSDITIPVCPICHRILSNKQLSWDKRWMNKENSDKTKMAFVLRGQSEVLGLMAKTQKELSEKILNGEI